MKRRSGWIAWTFVFTLMGCHGHDHDHDDHHGESGHGHEARGHGNSEKAHGHGHADSSTAYTRYAERTELFVEVPALVVGAPAELWAHITELDNLKALASGRVSVELSGAANGIERFEIDTAAIPGIFKPVVVPKHAGKRMMRVQIVSGEIHEVHALGEVEVFADAAAATAAAKAKEGHGAEEAAEKEISFTKEQQWRIDFGTAPVATRMIRPSFEAYGTIRARPDGEARITSPVAGRVAASSGKLRVGDEVERDQVVAMLTPRLADAANLPGLEQAVESSRLAKAQAGREVKRLQGLLASGGVSERRVQEAQYEQKQAATEYKLATQRLKQTQSLQSASTTEDDAAISLRTPVSGAVVAVHAMPGSFVEAGAELLHIVDFDRLWLEVHVTETHAKYLKKPQGVWFGVSGNDEVFELGADLVMAVGGVLDARTRTVPLYMAVDNTKRHLRVGMFADVHVLTDAPHGVVTVPTSAVVHEGGLAVVYVALGGESFARRSVRVGQQDGAFVEILGGVSLGERVVSVGAYAVRLATSKTQIPEHGHPH
jgi:RND family efflux transporter MFP subunit